ncbi:NlpC/P60 family protein [Defluviimonas sp. D31]|uniref:C40 family peptidase n=1 Tax=Defluviimonas sp. D31 TaxID=3083253 RepID=UPI00296F19B7|nr:NlpC/P60 family protein [Defluviimonas sp. D31]MDW4549677.1 NlpC/P60 family protein [Defluviimonas sp. D31]
MSDRRLTPANGRVAHVALEGQVAADRYVSGDWARIAAPLADLLARPDGPRDRQVLMGERVLVLDRQDGVAFVQAEKDGYCGYLAEPVIGADRAATHWVSAPATHLYREPDIKRPEVANLTLGARLTVTAERPAFLETAEGLFVPRMHLKPLGDWADDPAGVAESLTGTPYLWGGNSRSGIDCSGLVQAALLACGIACPGDSDLQEAALGAPLPENAGYRRGDLFFWKGHVAMAVSETHLIHANAFHMAVAREGIAEAIARIARQGDGRPSTVKRLAARR